MTRHALTDPVLIPEWLNRMVRDELAALCAVTKYAPHGHEEGAAAAAVWVQTVFEHLEHAEPAMSSALDGPRIRAGFRYLRANCVDFPAPAELLRALPKRTPPAPATPALPAPVDLPPELAAHRLRVLERAAQKIGRIGGRPVTVRSELYEKPQ